MDKKIAGLVGAVSAIAALNGAQAATSDQVKEMMAPTSYADLLKPIPNAVALLKMSDAVLVNDADTENMAKVQFVQYYEHHHHHHRFFRPFYHHHHHRYHHHHHHHHHHRYYAPY